LPVALSRGNRRGEGDNPPTVRRESLLYPPLASRVGQLRVNTEMVESKVKARVNKEEVFVGQGSFSLHRKPWGKPEGEVHHLVYHRRVGRNLKEIFVQRILSKKGPFPGIG